ncbi:glycosyltransferase family 4 protein [Microbulbifer halophilus]|uniref:Glycosyltransferase family 4 protein n=2 Tax=Microbulbifer halophilus TaxID=453963 RepID=A0ABW5EC80_9GAMM
MKISLVMISTGLGGVQQSLVPYALALKKRGHQLQILVSGRARSMVDLLVERGLGGQVEKLEGIWKLHRYLPHAGLRERVRGFAPDLVLGFAQMGFIEAHRALRGSGIPVLTRVGTMKSKRMGRFRNADGWLATTAEMKTALKARGFDEERIFIVPNFLAENSPEPEENSSQPGERDLRHPPRVGSLGRFVARKGFGVLIDAVDLLRERGVELECTIAGDGKDLDTMKARIDERGLSRIVHLPGWLGHGDKAEFLQGLDLFVCSSLDEPFGFVYLDAMRFGLPVVTTPTVGARFIFSDTDTACWTPFEDPASLADAIQRLLSDESRRAALGRQSRQLYATAFSLEAGSRNLDLALGQMRGLGKR